jgi:SH3-like domain-containing protein
MTQRSTVLACRRLAVPALLTLLSCGGLWPYDAGAGADRFVRVRVEAANLREGPSRGAEQVRYAFENEPLQVVARRGAWLEIRDFDGRSAWIYEPLTDRRPSVVVARDLVNVRARPGTDHPVVFTAERSVNLLVLGRAGQWLHVEHEVGEGWVHDSLVWGDP